MAPSTSTELNQNAAYDQAVLGARANPEMSDVVAASLLDEDETEALERFQKSEDWARIMGLLSKLGIRPPARVIDFGGGRGLVAASLAAEGFRSVLCEPNPSDISGHGAAKRLRARASLSFEISRGDIAELQGEGFDAAVCRAVLHHVEPLAPVLGQLRLALSNSGVLVCSDEPFIRDQHELAEVSKNHPFSRFGVEEKALKKSEYRRAFKEAGFEDIRIRFPVTWGNYRRFKRAHNPWPIAFTLYLRYRITGLIFPAPGDVRSITARVA